MDSKVSHSRNQTPAAEAEADKATEKTSTVSSVPAPSEAGKVTFTPGENTKLPPEAEALAARVKAYDPKADTRLILSAWAYAERAHANQKRASGEPYFTHPQAVAEILADLKLDDATIATGLLHDTVEDTEATPVEIERLFGKEVAELVDGVTKIEELDLVTKKAKQAENFRKLLLAISGDIRVLLVKLADRLHNMRTLHYVRPEKRARISEETMEIYAPLAGRMGIQWLRDELEEYAFRWRYPEAYRTVVDRLEKLHARNQGLIEEITQQLQEKLAACKIDARVMARKKKPFSVWKKMENRQISLEQLSDIYGFRIITKSVEDCYRVLGVVHTSWRFVQERFKDFISLPKENDYQSIHTTVLGPRNQRVELQIRTEEMHEVAEYGIAAHSLYKDTPEETTSAARRRRLQESSAYQWLRRHVDMLREGDNPEEFLENTRLELFSDQVFCFTPKGRLIVLPKGATPIDFAYAVHTDIGNRCVGCKINKRHMPLITPLKNGDEVEIITSDAQRPPAAWENIVKTGKARSAIRRATREAVREQFRELGRNILIRAFDRAGEKFREQDLEARLHRLSQNSVDEVLTAVGRGELSSNDVLAAVHPASQQKADKPKRLSIKRNEAGWVALGKKALGLKFRWPGTTSRSGQKPSPGKAIPIRGIKGDLPVRFAPRCGAVPGDRIVGILTPGEGITIYPIGSKALSQFDNEMERWIDVTWDIDEDNPNRFPAYITVTAINEPGSLAQIAQLIGECDGNIDNIRMLSRASDYTVMQIDLEVWDLKHLSRILSGLKALPVVNRVERIYG